MATATKQNIIRLNFSGDRVLVEPENGDRFIMTAEQAVEACKSAAGRAGKTRRSSRGKDEVILRRFERDFIQPLRAWCESNAGRVSACYVPFPAGHVEVYVVGKSAKYDFDLGSDLSGLELQLFDRGWRVNVVQLPRADEDDGLRAHFDYDGALEVYADRQPA